MQTVTHWGILGTGAIAKKFAEALQMLPDASLVAIGSRSRENAIAFGQQFNVTFRHDSYEDLVNNPAVDAVYIATPHSLHHENALAALNAGKPVLCEKPFAINAAQTAEIIKTAREKKLLLMEAMWTRFLPCFTRLRKLLKENVIGEVRMLAADFGFRAESEGRGRLFNPSLGGGALLDIGVYPISLASMIFGKPQHLSGLAHIGRSGVDKQDGIVLSYPRGQMAILHSSIEVSTFHEAAIMGTQGRIKIHSSWWKATAMTVMRENNKNDFIECPFAGNGYQFEAAEFMNCLRRKKLESEVMPLDETLAIMKTMDCLREQWGLKFPME
jgi:predicted dehydrogenase